MIDIQYLLLLQNLREITGGIFFSWREYFIKPTFVALLGTHTGNFISYFLGTFFGMVIFPIVITKLTKSDS